MEINLPVENELDASPQIQSELKMAGGWMREERDNVGKTEDGLANKITITIFIGGFTLCQVLVQVRQVVLLLLLHRGENGGTEMFSRLFRVIQPRKAKFGI